MKIKLLALILIILGVSACNTSHDKKVMECITKLDAATDSECEWCETLNRDYNRNFLSIDTDDRGLISTTFIEKYEDNTTEEFAIEFITPYEFNLLIEHSHSF